MMEDVSQTTLVGHIQKDPRNSLQSGTIPQHGLDQLRAKPSCGNFHIQFWGPEKMYSFYFPRVRRLFWSVKHVIVDHISVLTQHKGPGDQTVQDTDVSGGTGWITKKFQRLSKGTLISPAPLIFAGQPLLTCLKPRRAYIFIDKN